MMEHVKTEWIWLSFAFAAMLLVPWFLLSQEPENVPKAQPIHITQVAQQQIIAPDALLEKPIFNKDRSPVAVGSVLADAEPIISETPVQTAPAPTLVGLVSKRRGKAVAIIKTNDGETKTLKRGQSSDGWQLVSIGKNKATFASANEQKTIGLDYGNKAIGGPAGIAEPQTSSASDELIDGEPN